VDWKNRITEVFRFGVVQDCGTLIKLLLDSDVTIEAFLNWLEEEKRRYKPPPRSRVPRPPREVLKRKCPSCGKWLHLAEVNHSPRCRVGGDYKSQWFCPNCWWDEYSKKDIREEAKPYIEEVI